MSLSAEVKQAVRKSARNRCEYCQSQESFSPSAFSIEHIVPRSESGSDEVENLALSCQECNNRKFTAITAHDPLSGNTVPLYHPRQNHWSDHFAWNEDFTLLLGLTPTGRATIEKLHLMKRFHDHPKGLTYSLAHIPEVRNELLFDPQDTLDLRYYRERITTYYPEQQSLALATLDAFAREEPLSLEVLLQRVKLKALETEEEALRDTLTLLERDHYLRRSAEGYRFQLQLIRDGWRAIRGIA